MAIGFRTPIRKSPTKIEGSARLPRMLCSAAAEQKQAQRFTRYLGKPLGLFYLFRAGAYLSCGSRMDRHCMDRRGVQRGKAPLALGHPIGASSIPVGKGSLEGNSVPLGGRFPKEGSAFLGTRLSLGKSSVLYLCFRLTRERG